eukprot:snap_masked-scaffold_75-processed-gene-0.32-mRNA-1 protein AED:1.00 eAED:1.00 QI:0/-1/0/0/-1/1/1/0/1016
MKKEETGRDSKVKRRSSRIEKTGYLLNIGVKIQKLACGVSHCVLLDESFCVFTMGSNEFGQLGIINSKSGMIECGNKLDTIHRLSLKDMNYVAATDYTSCCFKEQEQTFFSWGYGKHGELGLGLDIIKSHQPKKVNFALEIKGGFWVQSTATSVILLSKTLLSMVVFGKVSKALIKFIGPGSVYLELMQEKKFICLFKPVLFSDWCKNDFAFRQGRSLLFRKFIEMNNVFILIPADLGLQFIRIMEKTLTIQTIITMFSFENSKVLQVLSLKTDILLLLIQSFGTKKGIRLIAVQIDKTVIHRILVRPKVVLDGFTFCLTRTTCLCKVIRGDEVHVLLISDAAALLLSSDWQFPELSFQFNRVFLFSNLGSYKSTTVKESVTIANLEYEVPRNQNRELLNKITAQGNFVTLDEHYDLTAFGRKLFDDNLVLEARRIFYSFDTDFSNELETSEFKKALIRFGFNSKIPFKRLTLKRCQNLIRKFDENNNGKISLEEFLSFAYFYKWQTYDGNRKFHIVRKISRSLFSNYSLTYKERRLSPKTYLFFAEIFLKILIKLNMRSSIKEENLTKILYPINQKKLCFGEVDFSNLDLADEHIEALKIALICVPVIKKLDLRSNKLTPLGAKKLIEIQKVHDLLANYHGCAQCIICKDILPFSNIRNVEDSDLISCKCSPTSKGGLFYRLPVFWLEEVRITQRITCIQVESYLCFQLRNRINIISRNILSRKNKGISREKVLNQAHKLFAEVIVKLKSMLRNEFSENTFRKEVQRVFLEADTDKSGFLELSEVGKCLSLLGEKRYSKEELLLLFKDIDADNNGRITLKEFTEFALSSGNKRKRQKHLLGSKTFELVACSYDEQFTEAAIILRLNFVFDGLRENLLMVYERKCKNMLRGLEVEIRSELNGCGPELFNRSVSESTENTFPKLRLNFLELLQNKLLYCTGKVKESDWTFEVQETSVLLDMINHLGHSLREEQFKKYISSISAREAYQVDEKVLIHTDDGQVTVLDVSFIGLQKELS